MVTLNVNGKSLQVDADPSMPLLWALRDVLKYTGTKYGCGIEVCGACTVLINGEAEKSCDMSVQEAVGKQITTIEGLSPDGSHPLQKAWIAEQVPQCGYCQSGMIMSAASLLNKNPNPTDAQIDGAIHNICVCGTYQRVRAAIHRAAQGGGVARPVRPPSRRRVRVRRRVRRPSPNQHRSPSRRPNPNRRLNPSQHPGRRPLTTNNEFQPPAKNIICLN